ncbi:TatD family deoxyribonuclease [Sphingomonadales bacterium 56]|uniref:TatD family hydrolase n=1 Tax=unclassified Sphingobium TaxID=2611147 RepID=UPI00191B5A33|nr:MULTISPECIES: TatD family hydrolase [unclassified Sphingobium]MBY2927679.1 TatD family deoxyribonuclease [Sphingomonadales bacterium 56]MBY2957779.1 TatD family deoxyribonuclease [Sphingomonadales bacterium 58]CAD7335718.1 putative metal-dependent hydrolase YcfH [Sphingobium sp. S6]CAD7335783.1 putative metal-dependent hydrolase YcfH [Sphingobium sp. S8]
MLIDSHCHLNYKGLIEDQQNVLERARAAGIDLMLNIATRESEWDAVLATAEQQPDVYATVGIHPHEADEHPHIDTAKLIERAAHPLVVGIGETGLDYCYDHSDRARQQGSFRAHIAASRATGLPLIVHTRDAEEDTLAILREEMGQGTYPGVIHCFTASGAFADAALDLGFYISISGIVTFKSAKDLQETAARLPLDRLLVETDSPFLAPVPHRGKPCEPAFVADTARFLANLRGQSVEELASATSANFRTLFRKTGFSKSGAAPSA